MTSFPETPVSAFDFNRGQVKQNDDGSITAPDNIIKTLGAARYIYEKFRNEHIKRIQLYSLIEGLISGNPPYNADDLRKQGLTHIANFNTLDARSLFLRSVTAYWNLLNQTEVMVKITLRGAAPELRRIEDTMSYHLDKVIRKWRSFTTLTGTMMAQLVKFGISPVIWPDERDWRWRTVELQKFFVADQAQSDIDQLTAVIVESTFTAQYLFEVYETFKNVPKKDSPWNCDELAKFLLYIANTFAKTEHEFVDFFDLQKRLQNGDLCYDIIFTDSIRIVSLLSKEYDGKISHYMFHRTYHNTDFLYFADRQYNHISEALVIFTTSPGEFTIHSNRGIGHTIFSTAQAMMQMDCSIVDCVRWSSTPLLRGPANTTKDFGAIRFIPGVPTNIGTAEFVANNMGSNVNQLIGASNYLFQKMQFNTANSGDDPSSPDRAQGSISNTQAKMMAYKEFSIQKINISHFYNQFDFLIQNVVAKMLHSKPGYPGYEYAEEWKRRCIEDGVPEEVFSTKGASHNEIPPHMDVQASRVAGEGSTAGRIMGLQELAQTVAADFGPKEAREYKRQWIMATMGPEYVESFMGSDDEDDIRSGGASLAGVENAVMQDGKAAVFSADNEHQSHLNTHLALAMDIMKRVTQNQMDAIAADRVLSVLVPHINEHFEFLGRLQYSQNYVAKVQKPVNDLNQYAPRIKQAAAQMMQAEIARRQKEAEQTQQVMNEEQRKNMQAVNDEKRKDLKIQSQVERAKEASVTRAEVMRNKDRMDADNKRLAIQLEHKNNQLATKNELANESTEEIEYSLDNLTGSTIAPYDVEND